MNREQNIKILEAKSDWTVLVVGAGINGIGTFRDLALQGIDVLLIDRDDFCSGASAASSHMVHGGIRYLENGEFRLVKEAVQERNRLIENAPHLVQPLPTVFPIFKIFSGLLNAPLKFLGLLDHPSERGAVVIKVGMTLYDLYTKAQKTVPTHKFLSNRLATKKFPRINPKIKYTGIYYDGAMPSPERICIELIGDGEGYFENARAINYLSLARIDEQGESVVLKDGLSGKEYVIRPKVLVNASGPWIDQTNQSMGIKTDYIGGTKGSHLILDNPELRQAIMDYEFFFENEDGRIVLIFPLGDKVMIGTSDIRVDSPDGVLCTEEETDYFFDMVPHIFPDIKVDRSQIVYRFSGVRPLPRTTNAITGQISRDHKIELIEAGKQAAFPVLSLVGGKWTSSRAFSEQTADLVLNLLGVERKQSTRDLKIGGGANFPSEKEELASLVSDCGKNHPLNEEILSRLLYRYGTRFEQVAEKIISFPRGSEDSGIPGYVRGELAFLIDHESVVHLDDLFLRRSMIGILGLLNRKGLEALGDIAAECLGWLTHERTNEINRAIEIMKHSHGVDLA